MHKLFFFSLIILLDLVSEHDLWVVLTTQRDYQPWRRDLNLSRKIQGIEASFQRFETHVDDWDRGIEKILAYLWWRHSPKLEKNLPKDSLIDDLTIEIKDDLMAEDEIEEALTIGPDLAIDKAVNKDPIYPIKDIIDPIEDPVKGNNLVGDPKFLQAFQKPKIAFKKFFQLMI